MSKAAQAFRTISEVADELEIPKHVLRFWELKFPQIKPMKRGGGRRYYRPEDVELLKGIRTLLHAEGYTIKGVQKILREQGVDAVKTAGDDGPKPTASTKSSKAAPAKAAPSRRGRSAVTTSTRRRATAGTATGPAPPKGTRTDRAAKSAANTAGEAGPVAMPPMLKTAIHGAIAELEACRSILRGETAKKRRAVKPRRAKAATR